MYVLDSDAIQASAAIVAANGDIVLVLRRGLLSAAELACLRTVLGPVVARLALCSSKDNDDSLGNTG